MNEQAAPSYFATTNGRLPHRRFGIKQADRLFHCYILGRTGVGKTTLLEMLALQDFARGRGVVVIDPHGDLAERLVRYITPARAQDLVYFNAPDPSQQFGYNPLRRVRPDKIPLAVSGLMEAFKKLWDEAWGVRMEHILRNALFALIEYGDAKLPDILRMLTGACLLASRIPQLQPSLSPGNHCTHSEQGWSVSC
jgi:hypothetical protein